MLYQKELDFLCNTLEKCHIRTVFLDPRASVDEKVDLGIQSMLHIESMADMNFYDIVNPIEEATIYKLVDTFSLTYIFFLLPGGSAENLLLIGPYMTVVPSSEQIMEWAEKNEISPKWQKQIETY